MGNARARLVLQNAFAQNAFEGGAVLDQTGAAEISREAVRDPALDDRFRIRRKAVIDPGRWGKQCARRGFAPIFDRTKFDLDVSGVCHRRIGAVEGPESLRTATPAPDYHCRGDCDCEAARCHGAGRNTQIAAGSPELARAATNKRSNSGANSEVRARDAVGIRAIR